MLSKLLYALRNWRATYRAWQYGASTQGGTITYKSTLSAKVIRADGKTRDLGVISRRVITTVGVKFLCDDFNAGGQDVSNMKFHAMGTDSTAEAASDTALGTEVESRVAGSQASATVGANATYTTVATITATAPRAITEHGVFDQLLLGGTLWDRSVFAVINLVTGDSIQFTYTLTANSGG